MRQNIAHFGNLLNQKGIVFQQPASADIDYDWF